MNHPATSSTSPRPLPTAWIDRLFERMVGFYGARFADAWRGTDIDAVKRIWAQELAELTRDELKRGVDSLSQHQWPPTLPEFLKLCRPPIDPKADWIEACEQMRIRLHGIGEDRWSRPQVYWASIVIGSHDLNNHNWESIKTRWIMALKNAKDDPIPEYRVQIPSPGKTQTNRVDAAKMVQELGAKVGLVKEKVDYKAWAKRILANPENFPHISVQFAHEALKTESGEIVA